MTRPARQFTRKPADTNFAASVPLDVTTLGIIRDRLRKARLELQEAYLHAQCHPEAASMVAAAGKPLRTALDAFEARLYAGAPVTARTLHSPANFRDAAVVRAPSRESTRTPQLVDQPAMPASLAPGALAVVS